MKYSIYESLNRKIISLVSNTTCENDYHKLIQFHLDKTVFQINNHYGSSPKQILRKPIAVIEGETIEELLELIPEELWL